MLRRPHQSATSMLLMCATFLLLPLPPGVIGGSAPGDGVMRKVTPPWRSSLLAGLTPPHTPVHSVSGFSSGADAAIIHQVAFSERVVGAGIQAGAPYGCQILPDCGDTCAVPNATMCSRLASGYYASALQNYTSNRSSHGTIAPLSNMRGRRVFLFSGLQVGPCCHLGEQWLADAR